MSLWVNQKRLHQRSTALISSLGKPSITNAQAKKLDALGLTYDKLVRLLSELKDGDGFSRILQDMGVHSKPLREKLLKLLRARASSGRSSGDGRP